MRKKAKYTAIRVSHISVVTCTSILASSIINNATIQVPGQEVGKIYDLSKRPTGEDAGKYFNHEWE